MRNEAKKIPTVDFRIVVGLEHLSDIKQAIRQNLSLPNLTPFGHMRDTVGTLKANSELLRSLYENNVDFPPERTVEIHTTLAMQQFQNYFAEEWQSPFVSKSLFRAMLLFHDVDTLATNQIMHPALEGLGFSSYETLIATNIAEQTFFKEYIENPYSEELFQQTCRNIEELETRLRIPKKDLLIMLNAFYVCTESANTSQVDMGVLSVNSNMKSSIFNFNSVGRELNQDYQPIPDRKMRRLNTFVENLHNDEDSSFMQVHQVMNGVLNRLLKPSTVTKSQFETVGTSTLNNTFLYLSSDGSIVIDLTLETYEKLTDPLRKMRIRLPGYDFFSRVEQRANETTQSSGITFYVKPTENIENLAFQITTAFDAMHILTIFEPSNETLLTQQLLAKQHRTQDPQGFMNQQRITSSDLTMQPAYYAYRTGHDRTAHARCEKIAGGEILLTHKLLDFDDIPNVVREGLVSLDMRRRLKIRQHKRTKSGDTDTRVGGSDSVFLWADVIKPNQPASGPILHKYDHFSDSILYSYGINERDAWLIVDPQTLGRLDWRGYDDDVFGSLEPQVLESHSFAPEVLFGPNIETRDICMPVGIPPSSFIGIMSATEEGRANIIRKLVDAGITEVNGVAVEDFVIVPKSSQDQLPSSILAKRKR